MRVRVTGINLTSPSNVEHSFSLNLTPVIEGDKDWSPMNIGPITLPLRDVSNYKIGTVYDLVLTPAK